MVTLGIWSHGGVNSQPATVPRVYFAVALVQSPGFSLKPMGESRKAALAHIS